MDMKCSKQFMSVSRSVMSELRQVVKKEFSETIRQVDALPQFSKIQKDIISDRPVLLNVLPYGGYGGG